MKHHSNKHIGLFALKAKTLVVELANKPLLSLCFAIEYMGGKRPVYDNYNNSKLLCQFACFESKAKSRSIYTSLLCNDSKLGDEECPEEVST